MRAPKAQGRVVIMILNKKDESALEKAKKKRLRKKADEK